MAPRSGAIVHPLQQDRCHGEWRHADAGRRVRLPVVRRFDVQPATAVEPPEVRGEPRRRAGVPAAERVDASQVPRAEAAEGFGEPLMFQAQGLHVALAEGEWGVRDVPKRLHRGGDPAAELMDLGGITPLQKLLYVMFLFTAGQARPRCLTP